MLNKRVNNDFWMKSKNALSCLFFGKTLISRKAAAVSHDFHPPLAISFDSNCHNDICHNYCLYPKDNAAFTLDSNWAKRNVTYTTAL